MTTKSKFRKKIKETVPVYEQTREQKLASAVLLMDKMIKEKDEIIKRLTRKNKVLKKRLSQSHYHSDIKVKIPEGMVLIGNLQYVFHENGINIQQDDLYEWLRAEGYLIRRKGDEYVVPMQCCLDMDLMRFIKKVVVLPDSAIETDMFTIVTEVGQQYFIDRWLSQSETSNSGLHA